MVILPMLTMLIGLLMGVCIMDTFYDNKQINQLERRIKRLERRVKDEVWSCPGQWESIPDF